MTKLPNPPGIAALRQIVPQTISLEAGTPLARVFFTGGPFPSRWNRFRSYGPTSARWDHHEATARTESAVRQRAILYCARDIDTCVAEAFQATRRINRIRDSPAVTIFALQTSVTLLDLRGSFATRIGASTAIHPGPRARTRRWAREIYEAWPDIQGIYYGSSMNGHEPAIALNERAESAIPQQPLFNRMLNDDLMAELLQGVAARLGYALR